MPPASPPNGFGIPRLCEEIPYSSRLGFRQLGRAWASHGGVGSLRCGELPWCCWWLSRCGSSFPGGVAPRAIVATAGEVFPGSRLVSRAGTTPPCRLDMPLGVGECLSLPPLALLFSGHSPRPSRPRPTAPSSLCWCYGYCLLLAWCLHSVNCCCALACGDLAMSPILCQCTLWQKC
jgi:hypothetical protein